MDCKPHGAGHSHRYPQAYPLFLWITPGARSGLRKCAQLRANPADIIISVDGVRIRFPKLEIDDSVAL